jgi:hypothetical protein
LVYREYVVESTRAKFFDGKVINNGSAVFANAETWAEVAAASDDAAKRELRAGKALDEVERLKKGRLQWQTVERRGKREVLDARVSCRFRCCDGCGTGRFISFPPVWTPSEIFCGVILDSLVIVI